MNGSATSRQAPAPAHSGNGVGEPLPLPLQHALSSLNVQLEQELARYRYTKQGTPPPPPSAPLQAARPALQWPGRTSQKLPAAPQRPAVTPPPPPPNPRLRSTAPAATPSALASPLASRADSEVAALRGALVRQASTAQPQTDYLASSAALLESLNTSGEATTPPTAAAAPDQRWPTPLGLGALMLLLVASAGLGFVLVNPATVQHLVEQTPLARWLPTATDDPAAEPTTSRAPAAPQASSAEPEAAQLLHPLSPDLSQQEFAELDLSRLSTLPGAIARPNGGLTNLDVDPAEADEATADSQSQAAAAAVASPTTTEAAAVPTTGVSPNARPSTQATRARSPQPSTREATAPTASPTRQTAPAAATSSQTAAVSASSGSSTSPADLYYVVTDYTGDPSLAAARETVGDAYVRNFETGARIQLGAFSSQASAAELVESLARQGIDARIHTPE